MSIMDLSQFSICFKFGILSLSIVFHLAAIVNGEQFQSAAEREAHLFSRNYGCKNLKELRPQEVLSHRARHTPKCGCGYYARRIHDSDPRQDLYNVTVTTTNGRLLRFECIQCDLCVGLKVTSVCKPKQNTVCSTVCEDPCETYISILKKCGPDKNKCQEVPTTTDTVIDSVRPQPVKLQETTSEHKVPDPESRQTLEVNYRSWLIVAAVVISASIIAVILIIIVMVCNQNKVHQNSTGSKNNSSDSLISSRSQSSSAEAAPV